MTGNRWLSPDRWRELEPILDAALELLPEQREAFIREASHGDEALHQQLAELLSEYGTPDVSLDEVLQESFVELLEEADAATSDMPASLTERFGIKGEIRRGRSATVYLARDVRHDREVALKVLQPALSAIIGAERFLAEIRVTANLRHPHIVPLFESGEIEGWIYYVMPLIEGETLRARLERNGALPVGEALKLLCDITDAVAYAHDLGVVHLDIKPDNILLGAGGPVVSDFGLAKALLNAPFIGALDANHGRGGASRLIAGTPGYMSPEQLEGSRDVDARSDVYSLGVVAWEMLAGKRLFPTTTLEDLRDAHLHTTPASLSEPRPEVSSVLSAVVHRALAKSPSDRFASATDLRAALEACIEEPVVSRRRRWRVPVAVVLAVLFLGGAAVTARWLSTRADAITARTLFDAGLRAQFAGNATEANRHFLAAIERDSTLSIAAIGAAGYALDSATWVRLAGQSVRHLARAPLREQLQIRLFLARGSNDPTASRIADSLRIIDPHHPEGHLESGNSLRLTGDFLASIPHFRRAIDLDSAGPDAGANCIGCKAVDVLTWTYYNADSLEAGERVAREAIARGLGTYGPWFALAWSYAHRDMPHEAMDAWRRARTLNPSMEAPGLPGVQLRLFLEDYADADRVLDSVMQKGQESSREDAMWWSVISLRNQGRFRDALARAAQFEGLQPHLSIATSPRAVILLETGRHEEARVLFEAVSSLPTRSGAGLPSMHARALTWGLTRAATAAAGMSDTTRLKVYADTIGRVGRLSALERDRRLHHYVRANLLVARGARREAVDEYRRAMESPTFGYTRINLELGQVLIRLGRYAEAIVVVRSALNGQLEGNNYYVTRTELHELLATAFDLDGARDSAAVHFGRVAAAWANGDPEFKARAERAERWLHRNEVSRRP